jgi:hypothetical protein
LEPAAAKGSCRELRKTVREKFSDSSCVGKGNLFTGSVRL